MAEENEDTVITGHFNCPLCRWHIDIPAGDDPVIASGVAAAMGVPADAFASIREHQAKQRIELDLKRHLMTHGPDEWLPALLKARRLGGV